MNRLALIFIVALVPLPILAQRERPTLPAPLSPTPTGIPAVHHYRVKTKHVATPTPSPSVTPGPNGEVAKGVMVCLPKQKWLELVDWFNGEDREKTEAESNLALAKKANDGVEKYLGMSVKDAKAVIDECATDKACAKAPLSCWFHRLIKHIFWIAGAIVVLLIVLIGINIMTGGALSGVFAIFGAIGRWISRLFTPKPPPPLP